MQSVKQCMECDTVFVQPATMLLDGKVYELCPNRICYGPIFHCQPVEEPAVRWAFMHIMAHGGFSETRRMNLRVIAESQMGPWDNAYRSL